MEKPVKMVGVFRRGCKNNQLSLLFIEEIDRFGWVFPKKLKTPNLKGFDKQDESRGNRETKLLQAT